VPPGLPAGAINDALIAALGALEKNHEIGATPS
jgi:hypothetical protein